ncbi:MAG: 7-cyano-7-deazaguanine synthase [Planctomycetota bacterium]|jgi:7-cyano-7-deazaguanine synthase
MSATATILLSGGIDSAACVHLLAARGFSTSAVFVDYGQAAAAAERQSAAKVAHHYGTPLAVIQLRLGQSYATGEIPGRNALFALAAYAHSSPPPGVLALGIHGGAPYYDCTPRFAEVLAEMLASYSAGRTRLLLPFAEWNKANVVSYCRAEGVPLELTYSCEEGGASPCGNCLSCRDREALGC